MNFHSKQISEQQIWQGNSFRFPDMGCYNSSCSICICGKKLRVQSIFFGQNIFPELWNHSMILLHIWNVFNTGKLKTFLSKNSFANLNKATKSISELKAIMFSPIMHLLLFRKNRKFFFCRFVIHKSWNSNKTTFYLKIHWRPNFKTRKFRVL